MKKRRSLLEIFNRIPQEPQKPELPSSSGQKEIHDKVDEKHESEFAKSVLDVHRKPQGRP